MFRRIVSLALVAVLAANTLAAVNWTNGDASGNEWNKSNNWDIAVPTVSDDAVVDLTGQEALVIADGTAASLNVGVDSADSALKIDVAALNVPNSIKVGLNAGSSGTITIEPDSSAPGVWNTLGCWVLSVGLNGDGAFINNGGTVKVYSEWFNIGFDGSGSGLVELNAGAIIAEDLHIGANGYIDIADGKLIINKDMTNHATWGDIIGGWVWSGQITAYGGLGKIYYDYNVTTPGATTVWAVNEVDWSFGGTLEWNDPNNWSNLNVPGASSQINILAQNPQSVWTPVLDIAADADWIYIGKGDGTAIPALDLVTGGDLVTTGIIVGYENDGDMTVDDAQVDTIYLGVGALGGEGLFEVNSGVVDVNQVTYLGYLGQVAKPGYGELVMTDGEFTTTSLVMYINSIEGDYFSAPLANGRIELNGGTINILQDHGLAGVHKSQGIDITGGSLVVAGDIISDDSVQWWIDEAKLTAYNGKGKIVASYDAVLDKTTITACYADGDQNSDCKVDLDDLAFIAANWLTDTN